MSQPSTRIHIAQPCHEKWAAMPPDALGRRCAACQESVVDFTSMTDGQVVAFLQQHPSVGCGRFTNDQLDRNLLGLAPPAPRWRRWLAAAAAALGFGAATAPAAQAQDSYSLPGSMPRPGLPDTPAAGRPAAAAEAAAPADSVRIYGTVHSRWGLPLQAWVRVRVGSEEHKVRANALGYFTLTVATAPPPAGQPAGQPAEQPPRLVVSRLYFRSQSQDIELKPHRAYHFFLQRRFHNWPWARRVTSGKFR